MFANRLREAAISELQNALRKAPLVCTKKRRPLLGRRREKAYCCWLESEVHAGADHAEIIVPPVHHVPAEIADPADMRR